MIRGNRHPITVDGQTFWVDSNQEEVLIRWLEANGFHKRWRHLDYGLHARNRNYTPDLELSIRFEDMSHRALVESKPCLAAFTPYISKRMRAAAKHYFTKMLLLYTHDTETWYRVDIKTGALTEFGVPVPGEIPIQKLYKPLTVRAPRVRSHIYRKRPEVVKFLMARTADTLEAGIKALFTPPRKPKRRRRR